MAARNPQGKNGEPSADIADDDGSLEPAAPAQSADPTA
jgi:hypothetical protein